MVGQEMSVWSFAVSPLGWEGGPLQACCFPAVQREWDLQWAACSQICAYGMKRG